MAETELERAQRLFDEGAARIERQRALISELRADGHADLAEKAAQLLGQLLALQAEHEANLRKLRSP